MPKKYDVEDIDISSILLNGVVLAEVLPYEIEDEDKIPDLKIKFNRTAVQEILEVGESESIMITGQFEDGITAFGGTDRIRVIKEVIV